MRNLKLPIFLSFFLIAFLNVSGIVQKHENIRVNKDDLIEKHTPAQLIKKKLKINSSFEIVKIKQNIDDLGLTHSKYKTLYKGVEIDGGEVLYHEKNGIPYLISGTILNVKSFSSALDIISKSSLE